MNSSDGWTVVKKKQKTKKLLCPQSTVSGVFNGSFRAPICESGTKSYPGLNISGPRCSQIQMGFNASPFSGRNTSVSASANKNIRPIMNDPDVLSLERLLRVKSKVELRLPGRLLDSPPDSVLLNQAGRSLLRVNSADDGVQVATVPAARAIAGDSERIHGLLEVPQLAEIGGAAESAAHATAGDSEVGFACLSIVILHAHLILEFIWVF